MKWYELTFKPIQPLHLGGQRWGVIADTRIFITGQTMWGALTNAYAPHTNSLDPVVYKANGEIFQTITCFYPTLDDQIQFPQYIDGEFHLGEYSEKRFRYEFTETIISTSIVPGHRAAKDESLHEVTALIPRFTTDKKELYWTGIIGIENESADNFLKEGLEIYVGGEITYGLGLIKLIKKKECDNDILEWNITINLDNNSISMKDSSKPIANYLHFSNIHFEGELELLADIDHKNNPPLTDAKHYIKPGSKVYHITGAQQFTLSKGKLSN